ncbi:hypothetical protein ZEAMMB73_Zm00001d014207 [Zea mays]|uniref:Uncharacterized protein n=1 Tax=Zea mays TaxID=4577 RepID=A0A1D6GR10_MAIZE|nr:hypothetical protein ZEAMMB73_Zm00001d014207 [Zea mays]
MRGGASKGKAPLRIVNPLDIIRSKKQRDNPVVDPTKSVETSRDAVVPSTLDSLAHAALDALHMHHAEIMGSQDALRAMDVSEDYDVDQFFNLGPNVPLEETSGGLDTMNGGASKVKAPLRIVNPLDVIRLKKQRVDLSANHAKSAETSRGEAVPCVLEGVTPAIPNAPYMHHAKVLGLQDIPWDRDVSLEDHDVDQILNLGPNELSEKMSGGVGLDTMHGATSKGKAPLLIVNPLDVIRSRKLRVGLDSRYRSKGVPRVSLDILRRMVGILNAICLKEEQQRADPAAYSTKMADTSHGKPVCLRIVNPLGPIRSRKRRVSHAAYLAKSSETSRGDGTLRVGGCRTGSPRCSAHASCRGHGNSRRYTGLDTNRAGASKDKAPLRIVNPLDVVLSKQRAGLAADPAKSIDTSRGEVAPFMSKGVAPTTPDALHVHHAGVLGPQGAPRLGDVSLEGFDMDQILNSGPNVLSEETSDSAGLHTMREGTSKESAETSRGEAVPSVSEGVTPAALDAPYVHHVEALGPQDTPQAKDVSVEDHDVDQILNLGSNVLLETSGGAESAETSRGEAVPSMSEGVTPPAPDAPYVRYGEVLGPQDTPQARDVSVEDHDVDQILNLGSNVLSEEASCGTGHDTISGATSKGKAPLLIVNPLDVIRSRKLRVGPAADPVKSVETSRGKAVPSVSEGVTPAALDAPHVRRAEVLGPQDAPRASDVSVEDHDMNQNFILGPNVRPKDTSGGARLDSRYRSKGVPRVSLDILRRMVGILNAICLKEEQQRADPAAYSTKMADTSHGKPVCLRIVNPLGPIRSWKRRVSHAAYLAKSSETSRGEVVPFELEAVALAAPDAPHMHRVEVMGTQDATQVRDVSAGDWLDTNRAGASKDKAPLRIVNPLGVVLSKQRAGLAADPAKSIDTSRGEVVPFVSEGVAPTTPDALHVHHAGVWGPQGAPRLGDVSLEGFDMDQILNSGPNVLSEETSDSAESAETSRGEAVPSVSEGVTPAAPMLRHDTMCGATSKGKAPLLIVNPLDVIRSRKRRFDPTTDPVKSAETSRGKVVPFVSEGVAPAAPDAPHMRRAEVSGPQDAPWASDVSVEDHDVNKNLILGPNVWPKETSGAAGLDTMHGGTLNESAETSCGEAVPSVSEGVTPVAPGAPYVHHVEVLGPQDTPRARDVSVEDHDVDQILNFGPNVLPEETSGGAGVGGEDRCLVLGVFAERLASEAQSSAVVSRLTSEKKALSHELERSRADSSDLARRLEAAEAESRRLLALLAESNKERESLCREVRQRRPFRLGMARPEPYSGDMNWDDKGDGLSLCRTGGPMLVLS